MALGFVLVVGGSLAEDCLLVVRRGQESHSQEAGQEEVQCRIERLCNMITPKLLLKEQILQVCINFLWLDQVGVAGLLLGVMT